MRADISGLNEAIANMRARAARAGDLKPAFETFGEDLVTRIDNNYRESREWNGDPFAPLKPSTIAQRIGKLPGVNKRNNKGKLTKAARGKRRDAKMLVSQGMGSALIKPLIDTAAMVNSNHIQDVDQFSFEWSSLGYLGYHMTGTTRMEARNPTPFEWRDGRWQINEDVQKELVEAVQSYVVDGEK